MGMSFPGKTGLCPRGAFRRPFAGVRAWFALILFVAVSGCDGNMAPFVGADDAMPIDTLNKSTDRTGTEGVGTGEAVDDGPVRIDIHPISPADPNPGTTDDDEDGKEEPEVGDTISPLKGQPAGSRQPQWPLKSAQTIYTASKIAAARVLTSTHPDAIVRKNSTIALASYWLTVPDEQLYMSIPDSRVPRAVDVSLSSDGCPIHGTSIFSYGSYPWILDREHPYQVKCPVGNEVYPSNDFSSFLETGMQDRTLLTGSYADDGHGWTSSTGHTYWFVAYAVHWHYRQSWISGASFLAQAYALTGDRAYARKAIVILDRIASVYPQMDHRTQTREGILSGGSKRGKIINSYWESTSIRQLAAAYDLVFDALVGSNPISLPWRTPVEIRRNIEANLLEEAMDAYDLTDIDGQYGTHQSALIYAATARGCAEARNRMIDRVFRGTGGEARYEGFDYALYNIVFKDGLPYNSSPFYSGYMVSNFGLISDVSPIAGINLFDYEKVRLMYDAPLQELCNAKFTPNCGDSGSPTSLDQLPYTTAYESAYRETRNPAYAWTLNARGALTDVAYLSFDELFKENIDVPAMVDAASYDSRLPSRFFDGYGMAFLNNDADTVGLSMYYGVRASHAHMDRLNIELFAHDKRISPDLGYPDFTNMTTPGRYAWTANTISHNTVAVDNGPQTGNEQPQVMRFHDGDGVKVVDVSAPTSYSNTTKYRRTLVLVEVGNDAYVVDVFRVKGGGDHVMSIHGQEGAFSLAGGTLSAVNSSGTLAGSSVPYSAFFGGAAGAPDYNAFTGGYSFFYNWQNAFPTGVVTGLWSGGDGTQLRVHVAPNSGQELVVADARVSPLLKIPTILKYMLLRRRPDANGSTFVNVWELANSSIITGNVVVSGEGALGVGADRTVVVQVPHGTWTDTIAIRESAGASYQVESGVTTDSAIAFISRNSGVVKKAFAAGGTTLTATNTLAVPPTLTGTISSVNYVTKTIVADVGNSTFDPTKLAGRTVRIWNSKHPSAYRIASASKAGTVATLTLTGSDVITGRLKITGVDVVKREVHTQTSVWDPVAMRGMYLVTQDFTNPSRIDLTITNTRYVLTTGTDMAPFSSGLAAGQDAWIVDFGPTDQIEIEQSAQASY